MTTSFSLADIKQTFTTPDGVVHNSKKEAEEHLRRPAILAALLPLTGDGADGQELANWLLTNREEVENAFDVGTIRRVTKSERNQLAKAMEHLVEAYGADKKLSFLVENKETVVDSFRWPTQQRMAPEEKAVATRNSIQTIEGGTEELANWVVENKEAILAAFEAGKIKREVPAAAAAGLAAYQERRKAEKAAAAAAAAEQA